jgi:hypothetical protein
MDYGNFVSNETDSRLFERISYFDGEHEVLIKDDAMITFFEGVDPILDCEPIESLSENKRILIGMFKEECIDHSKHYPAIKLENIKFDYDGESAVFFYGIPFNIKYIDLLISINQPVLLMPSKNGKSLVFYTPNMGIFGKIMSMSPTRENRQ